MTSGNNTEFIAFGPVPSRRLGKSLGINNIPPKNCSYACVYCQVGITPKPQIKRQTFYKPAKIFQSVDHKLQKLKARAETVDYLTFVSDGEPTLDENLGKHIELLKLFGIKIAVITNASLLWQKEVQHQLSDADLISVKIDAVSENAWHKINRPEKNLNLQQILNGILEFSRCYKGTFLTETLLVRGINDNAEETGKIADFISMLRFKKSYISVPIRPAAESWVDSPSEEAINIAYQIFKESDISVETIIGHEGNSFVFSGDVEENLLSIASVHPMREESVLDFLTRARVDTNIIHKLITEDKLREVQYKDIKFYVRKVIA